MLPSKIPTTQPVATYRDVSSPQAQKLPQLERESPPHLGPSEVHRHHLPSAAPEEAPKQAPAKEKKETRLLTLEEREPILIRKILNSDDISGYWDASSDIVCAAPACGVIPAKLYTLNQRVALLNFTLFNWVITQGKNRYFARRTHSSHLWFELGEPPAYRLDHVMLPLLATRAQMFDLIPTAAYHGEQIANRCQRPEGAISAAAANKSRREAEQLQQTQMQIQAAAAMSALSLTRSLAPSPPSSLSPSHIHAAQPQSQPQPQIPTRQVAKTHTHTRLLSATQIDILNATSAMSQFLSRSAVESEAFYLQNPLRFGHHEAGIPVVLGSSSTADVPAPGVNSNGGVIGTRVIGSVSVSGSLGSSFGAISGGSILSQDLSRNRAFVSAPKSTHGSPTGSFSSFDDPITPLEDHKGLFDDPFDPFPGVSGLDPRLLTLLYNGHPEEPKPAATSDWVCPCGVHNSGGRTQCTRLGCDQARLPQLSSAALQLLAAISPEPVTVITPTAPAPAPPPSPAPALPAERTLSRSVLGDPGDWYCDYCGLCNWARRAYCLRCCPLHPDNIEEAITKGILHAQDPIIDLLGHADKRARALSKAPARRPTATVSATGAAASQSSQLYCPCFGPHHGTRCGNVGGAVPDELWSLYTTSQNELATAAAAIKTKPLVPIQLHAGKTPRGSPAGTATAVGRTARPTALPRAPHRARVA